MSINGYLLRFFGLCLLFTFFVYPVSAQTDSVDIKKKDIFSVGLGVQRGFIFAHSEEVENTKGSHPTGVEVILSRQSINPSIWELCNCFPRKGLLLAYYDYNNTILGKSITAAYFLEPMYRLGKRTFFSFRGSAGVSYLTNPFDSIKNPSNRSYSTSINAYLLVGAGIWYRLNDQWWINASANYQHESNGGMREPNKGINWPTAGVTVSYQKTFRPFYNGSRTNEKFWINRSFRWDLALFGIAKRHVDPQGKSKRLPLVGFSVQAAKQVGRINMLTLGTEISRDEELRVKLNQASIEASPVTAGLIAGHEFILGKFLFSQRLGIYVFDQTPYFDQLYHRWGLHYRTNKRWGLGFTLKAHRQVADYADLRISYSIQKNDQ